MMWYENHGSDYNEMSTMEEFDFRLHPEDANMQQTNEATNKNSVCHYT